MLQPTFGRQRTSRKHNKCGWGCPTHEWNKSAVTFFVINNGNQADNQPWSLGSSLITASSTHRIDSQEFLRQPRSSAPLPHRLLTKSVQCLQISYPQLYGRSCNEDFDAKIQVNPVYMFWVIKEGVRTGDEPALRKAHSRSGKPHSGYWDGLSSFLCPLS